MKPPRAVLAVAFAVLSLMAVMDPARAQENRPYATIPAGHDADLKFYSETGVITKGVPALTRMQSDADLILWLAGNQFFAMDDVVASFQRLHPNLKIALVTLPPGLLLEAIKEGGWRYESTDFPGLPDIYASVNLGHLKELKSIGLMQSYMIYMHNELQIMVAKGNPKSVRGIDDLGRPDMRTSLPNPVNEGIMQFYARKVLERHGLWQTLSGGQECASCQTSERNWFTAVHHRETPERIRNDQSDAGIVWKTEALESLRDGAPVEAVELPPEDSLCSEVAYAVGGLVKARHPENAAAYLAFLRSDAGQNAYAKFGFVGATKDELTQRPLP
jgi:ABC-type molybdate transport system substrate-binding protein